MSVAVAVAVAMLARDVAATAVREPEVSDGAADWWGRAVRDRSCETSSGDA